MMKFWLNDYLPNLYVQAADFLNQQNLHFSWRLLRRWFLRRYARIERCLRMCDMDFRAATKLYFSEVKPNIAGWVQDTFVQEDCLEMLLEAKSSPRPPEPPGGPQGPGGHRERSEPPPH